MQVSYYENFNDVSLMVEENIQSFASKTFYVLFYPKKILQPFWY